MVGDCNATICINTMLELAARLLSCFWPKARRARGDKVSELSCNRMESEQFNFVRNLIPCEIKNNFKCSINIYITSLEQNIN